jgi:hypothetical protein
VAGGFNGGYVYNGSTYSYGSSSISQVTGIDGSGNIVGYEFDSNFTASRGIYGPINSPSTFTVPGATSTEAEGVSDNGIIAGLYVNGSQRMFIKDGSNITTFSYPGGGSQQYLWDANDTGDAVGLSACCDQGVSFLKQGNTFTTISVPGISNNDVVAYGLNDQDTVVGYYYDGTTEHGFIWQNGTSTTFDFPGATATILFDINDSGEIFGGYTNAQSQQFNFLAMPSSSVPEPGTWGLFLTGLGLAIAGKRRFSRRH